MTNQIYILDTNVWISNPECFLDFNGIIVIPYTVLEELDYLKISSSEYRRFKSRMASKGIKSLIDDPTRMVQMFDDTSFGTPHHFDRSIIRDLKIIQAAKHFKNNSHYDVSLVTNDLNVSLRAQADHINVLPYDNPHVKNEIFTGYYKIRDSSESEKIQYENSFGLAKNGTLFRRKGNKIIGICEDSRAKENSIFGIEPLNPEQLMAMELLMDPDVKIITLEGRAGSGKTLLATACGLRQLLDKSSSYNRLSLSKPIIEVQAQVGYLPGSAEDKIKPHFESYNDAFEIIWYQSEATGIRASLPSASSLEDFLSKIYERKNVRNQCLSYVRGRSFRNQFMIIDEAQNLSKHEIFTIISRAGVGTKVVLLGDSNQIDARHLTKYNNGFTIAQQKFRGHKIYGHVTFSKSERSDLAEIACNLLS